MKSCRNVLSAVVLSLSLLFATGCAARLTPEESFRQANSQIAYFSQEYGLLEGGGCQPYLEGLIQRLRRNAPRASSLGDPRVILVRTDRPIAFALGANSIALSQGFIRRIGSEAELAFVVAHELAHEIKGHTTLRREADDQWSRSLDEELTADRYAIGMIILAGYDPRLATRVLAQALTAPWGADFRLEGESSTRINAIEEEIRRYQWRPPGTVTRADFRAFRKAVVNGCQDRLGLSR